MENDVTSIVLTDEDGKEAEFDIITKLDIEDKEYVIVAPKEDEDGDEAIALRIDVDEDGNEVLVTVDDDSEFAIVCEAYETLFAGEDIEIN